MSYYGANFWRALWASWRDRRAGRLAQANARWGRLRLPGERGPVLWLQGGASAELLQLGVELSRAISNKRKDIRLILTFEAEPPGVFTENLGIDRFGYGFGPCAHPRALSQTLSRLQPLRYMGLGRNPSAPMAALLQTSGVPALALGTSPDRHAERVPWEAIYPHSAAAHQAWREAGFGSFLQEAVDFFPLITVAQVDPNFRNLILGSLGDALFWVTALQPQDWSAWRAAWEASPLQKRGILFLEGQGGPEDLPSLSQWKRDRQVPGRILRVDEERWYPALAASCDAVHLQSASRAQAWQIFAGGRPLSQSPGWQWSSPREPAPQIPILSEISAVLAHWQQILNDPIAAREEADAYRRYFWQERRQAAERLPELLQRIFDW